MSLKSASHSSVGVCLFAESEIKHLGSITSKIKEASYGTTGAAWHQADKCMFYFRQSLPLAVNLLDKLNCVILHNFALITHPCALTAWARHIYLLLRNIFPPTCAIRSLFLQQKRYFRKLNSIFRFSIFFVLAMEKLNGWASHGLLMTSLICLLFKMRRLWPAAVLLVDDVCASIVAYHETTFWFPLFVRVCAAPPPSKPAHTDYSLIYDSVLKKTVPLLWSFIFIICN